MLQKYYFDGGQKFMHVPDNEWSLEFILNTIYLFFKLDKILLHIFQLSEVIELLHITDETVAVQFMTVGNFA